MLVVEGRSEQESKRNLVLCGRNVADPFEGGIAERIVDCVIVEKLIRSRHCASCHVAQLFCYHPYLIRIVRKKFFHNVNQRQSAPILVGLLGFEPAFFSSFVSDPRLLFWSVLFAEALKPKVYTGRSRVLVL